MQIEVIYSKGRLAFAQPTRLEPDKYLPGSRIPILPPEALNEHGPDELLILPWNIAEELGRLYEVVERDAGHGMARIIDESGEDYLYPQAWFDSVALSVAASEQLAKALPHR